MRKLLILALIAMAALVVMGEHFSGTGPWTTQAYEITVNVGPWADISFTPVENGLTFPDYGTYEDQVLGTLNVKTNDENLVITDITFQTSDTDNLSVDNPEVKFGENDWRTPACGPVGGSYPDGVNYYVRADITVGKNLSDTEEGGDSQWIKITFEFTPNYTF